MELSSLLINNSTMLRRTAGEPSKLPENLLLLSDTLGSDYLPFYNVFFSDFLKVGDVRYILYYLPTEVYTAGNKTAHALAAVSKWLKPYRYSKGGKTYYIAMHMIWEVDLTGKVTVLYSLIVKKDYVYNMKLRAIDKTQFIALVNNKFATDPEHKLMYSFIRKEVINPLVEGDIDLVHTNDVHRWCFKSSSLGFKFSTFVEMQQQLKLISNEAVNELLGNSRRR